MRFCILLHKLPYQETIISINERMGEPYRLIFFFHFSVKKLIDISMKARKKAFSYTMCRSIIQVPCSLLQRIMTFHASLSLVTFSASVTYPTFNLFGSPFSIFSRCFPLLCFLSINPVVTRCSSFSLLITQPKKFAWPLCILVMSGLVVSASRNTASFDFCAVHKITILYILHKNHICVASSLF